eukprot:Pgem_evm1s5644
MALEFEELTIDFTSDFKPYLLSSERILDNVAQEHGFDIDPSFVIWRHELPTPRIEGKTVYIQVVNFPNTVRCLCMNVECYKSSRKIAIPPGRRKLWRSILQPGNTDPDILSITRIKNQNVNPTLEYQWSNESEYELRKVETYKIEEHS